MNEYAFPWWANPWWMIGALAVSLLLFHCLLVWFRNLTSVGWKRVDYIWVSLAFLGVLGTVAQSREIVASNHRNLAQARAKVRFEWFKDAVAFGHSPAICRTFVRSEFSPPEEQMKELQLGYNAQCEWFK